MKLPFWRTKSKPKHSASARIEEGVLSQDWKVSSQRPDPRTADIPQGLVIQKYSGTAQEVDVLAGWDTEYHHRHPEMITLLKPCYGLIHHLLWTGSPSAIQKLLEIKEFLDLADAHRHLNDASKDKRQDVSVRLTNYIATAFTQEERDAYQMQQEMAEWGLESP